MSQNPSDPGYNPYNRPPATPSPQADEAFLRNYGQAPRPPRQDHAAPPTPGPYTPPTSGFSPYGVPTQPQHMYGMAPRPSYVPSALSNNMTMNYWLSAVFGIIPALIFYLIDKDKHPLHDAHLKAVMNFQLTRLIAGLFTFIPGVGWLIVPLFLILSIIGAVQGTRAYGQGQTYKYPLAINLLT